MFEPPKAQRLTRMFNEDDFSTLSEDQVVNLIETLRNETEKTIKIILEKVPYTI